MLCLSVSHETKKNPLQLLQMQSLFIFTFPVKRYSHTINIEYPYIIQLFHVKLIK